MTSNPWNKFIEVTNHGKILHFKTDFAIHDGTLDKVVEDLINFRNEHFAVAHRDDINHYFELTKVEYPEGKAKEIREAKKP